MTNETQSNAPEPMAALGRLERLYEAYGANPARWPEAGQTLLAAHVTDPRVAAIAAEAQGLDRLLAHDDIDASADSRSRALADRICARAEARGGAAPTRANVLAFVSPTSRISVASRRAGYAALAASLLLGVFVGTSGAGANAIRFASDAYGLSDEEPELASSADLIAPIDEVL